MIALRPAARSCCAPRTLRRPVERRLALEALENRVHLSADVSRSLLLPAMLSPAAGGAGGESATAGTIETLKAKPPAKTAPLPASIQGPDSNGNVTITGKVAAKGLVQVERGVGGPVIASTKADKKGHFTVMVQVGFGTTTLQVLSKNGKKNLAATFNANRPDTTPPVITAQPPAALLRSNPTISGQVTDVGSGVASLTEQVDNGPVVPVSFGASGAFQLTTALGLDGSADGAHTVHLRASDNAGNAAAPVDLTFKLDTQPPVVAVTTVAPPSGFTRQDPAIAGQVTDTTSGVSALTEQVDNGAAAPLAFDASGNFSFTPSLPMGGAADGPHTVHFVATDRAGNVSAATNFAFTLDSAPPAITINSPAQNLVTNQDPTVAGQVSDALSHTAALTVQVDGGQALPVTFDASGNFSFTPRLPTNGSADGPHTLTFAATDEAGNSSGPVDYRFTLNTGTTGPAVAIAAPAQNLLTNQDPTITGQVSNAASLTAQVDTAQAAMVTIGSGGQFSFAPTLATSPPSNQAHTVTFVATDASGHMSAPAVYHFTLKTTLPAVPSLELDEAFAAPPPATDNETTDATITLDGQTDPNTSVTLQPVNQTKTSDSSGEFSFTGLAVALGANTFNATATDAAGNTSHASITITRITSGGTSPLTLQPVADVSVMGGFVA
jgi:hypothetical protein